MLNTQLKLHKISTIKNPLSRGFTLIELMIVIVILAILAVVVVIAINPAQRIASANNSRVRSDLSSIGSSASQYSVSSNGIYPSTFGFSSSGITWNVLTSPAEATGNVSIILQPAACTTACTAVAFSAASYPDGTTVNGLPTGSPNVWCWKSTTGTLTLAATCTLP